MGQGYWVRFPSSVSVTLPGTAAGSNTDFALSLAGGWNQIGDPFPSSISVGALTVLSGSQSYPFGTSVSVGLIGPSLYRYDPTSGSYVTLGASDTLQPGLGYWIYVAQAITLDIPPP